MLAYGVVFVLLIGEIDLSIGYVSGVAGMIAALLANPAPAGPGLPGWLCIAIALACTTIIGAFQGSFVALIGVPSFVVTLAGFLIWQGVIQLELPGVIVIQDNTINNVYGYFFSDLGGWIIGIIVSVALRRSERWASALNGGGTASRSATRSCSSPRLIAIPAVTLRTVCDLQQGPRRPVRAPARRR